MRKAVTIATRYSCIRHQSELKPGYGKLFECTVRGNEIYFYTFRDPEPQILEYVTQQNKLFPPLAATFGFHFAAHYLWELYNAVKEGIGKGDLHLMPDVSK